MRRLFSIFILALLIGTGCGGQKKEAGEEQTLKRTPGTSDEVAVITTRFGKIVLEFFPDAAPNHVANFIKLATEGFYNGISFHRVIPGFVVQGGCPYTKDDDRRNDGLGGPGYNVNAEFNQKKHLRGTLAMARSQDPNSAGSQFYICLAPQPALDGQYTVFGQVLSGMEVVDQITTVPRDERDNPLDPIVMESVKIIDRMDL